MGEVGIGHTLETNHRKVRIIPFERNDVMDVLGMNGHLGSSLLKTQKVREDSGRSGGERHVRLQPEPVCWQHTVTFSISPSFPGRAVDTQTQSASQTANQSVPSLSLPRAVVTHKPGA